MQQAVTKSLWLLASTKSQVIILHLQARSLQFVQLKVLKSVEQEYAGRTIGNIIQNLESRLKFYGQEGIKP